MKTIAGEFAFFMRGKARQNVKILVLYCLFLLLMVVAYAHLFQYFMLTLEGRRFSFIAGVYWVITVMTTLGFGDITFHTDRVYFRRIVTIPESSVDPAPVRSSAFSSPWIEHRSAISAGRRFAETKSATFYHRANPSPCFYQEASSVPIVCHRFEKFEEVQRLEEDEGIRAVYGEPSNAEVLKRVRVAQARQVVLNRGDTDNTNLILTIRSLCSTPITVILEEPEHSDLLRLAGADHVIPLKQILGRYLATRSTTKGAPAHVLDSFGQLLMAELPLYGTPFAGKPLSDAGIREQTGIAIIGVWERGKVTVPTPASVLPEDGVVLLLGMRPQLDILEKMIGGNAGDDLVVILGHGRIGCSAATYLDQLAVPFVLVDKVTSTDCSEHIAVIGDATSPMLLQAAAIETAKGLIATTNDDGVNILFTLASRHLNPHIRIVARANREENVDELYAAGADFVVSNTSVGANILMNILENKESFFLSEGLEIERYPVPAKMNGLSLSGSRIRSRTGSTVIAIIPPDEGEAVLLPSPETILRRGMTLMVIGSPEQQILCRSLFRG